MLPISGAESMMALKAPTPIAMTMMIAATMTMSAI
jgi:hypothetical protein